MDKTKDQVDFKKALEAQDLPALVKLAQQMGDSFTAFINMAMDDHNLPLIVAVTSDAIDIITFLLHHGADINGKGLGETALYVAVDRENTQMVQLLLLHKPNVNARCSDGFSALYWAAWRGRYDIVSLLLAAKARVDIKTSDRETPLYAAANKGHLNIVKLLVEKGAKVNMICGDGEETALCAACSKDHPDIVQYLLTQGANPNGIGNETPEDFYAFPLLGACSGAVVELLIAAGAAIHTRNRHHDTALHGLVRKANDSKGTGREKCIEALKVLLAHGADPLAQNQSHVNTPLALSASPDITILLQEAIARKSKPDTGVATKSDNLGQSMFKMAHDCDNAEQVAALIVLLQQANFDEVRYQSPEDHDATILHNIIGSAPYDHSYRKTPFAPYLEAVTLLLEKGADVNAQGSIWKGTPLHIAVKRSSYAGKYNVEAYQQGYADLIQLLIAHKADLSALNRDGCSPLDLATHGPVIDLLKEKGVIYAALSDEVMSRIKEGNMTVFEKGMSIELKDKEGNTPFLIAALKNSIPAIEYLVKKGADTQARNSKWKNNALDIACLACSIDAIRYMVTHASIDINAQDPISDDTALHYLAAWQPTFHTTDPAGMKKAADETCVWMIQNGAAINLKNKNGETATDRARTKKLAAEMIKAAKKNNNRSNSTITI